MSQAPERARPEPLPPTSHALLGLLSLRPELSGYEVKQLADATLRFYWTSPAMSQVYSELGRLADLGLVSRHEDDAETAGRPTTRFRITDSGMTELRSWLVDGAASFPLLKHPIALRLLLGHLVGDAAMRNMLEAYREQLDVRRRELQTIRDHIGDDPSARYPGYVADWGLGYYEFEDRMASDLIDRLQHPD